MKNKIIMKVIYFNFIIINKLILSNIIILQCDLLLYSYNNFLTTKILMLLFYFF